MDFMNVEDGVRLEKVKLIYEDGTEKEFEHDVLLAYKTDFGASVESNGVKRSDLHILFQSIKEMYTQLILG